MIPGLGLEICRRIWKYFIKPDTEIAIKDYKDQVGKKKKKTLGAVLRSSHSQRWGNLSFKRIIIATNWNPSDIFKSWPCNILNVICLLWMMRIIASSLTWKSVCKAQKNRVFILPYLYEIYHYVTKEWGFPVQSLPALQEMQETPVWSLGQEDPLEKNRQPTPIFLPVESHGQRSLVGYSPQGRKESNTTKQLITHTNQGVDDNYLSVKIYKLINERWR